MLLLVACVAADPDRSEVPERETSDDTSPDTSSDTSGDTSGDTDAALPSPLVASGCAPVIDVGVIGVGVDDIMAYAPSVVRDGATWRMWYGVAGGGGARGIAHARSADGLTWVEHARVQPPTSDGSAPMGLATPNVLRVGASWWMYADTGAGDTPIVRCVSDDGLTWGGCTGVIARGQVPGIDDDGAISAHVVPTAEGYRAWYTGVAGDVYRLLSAESPDGLIWGAPHEVLPLGAAAPYDTASQYNPFVFQDGEVWRMIYAGRAPYTDGDDVWQVKRLLQTWSTDGTTWEEPSLFLDLGCAGAWDAWRADEAWLTSDGDGWRMWYDGFDHPITSEGRRRVLGAAVRRGQG